MYYYCLFCRTQRCKIIARLLEIRGVSRAFSPQIVRRQRKEGVNEEVLFDLLPGYVFVYNETPLTEGSWYWGIDGVIRRIGRAQDLYQLVAGDLDFAQRLYEKDGLVGAMKAVHEGDAVRLEDPLFAGCEGKIVKIDYRKQRAKVEFVFNNNACSTWIACDCVRPLKAETADELPPAHPEKTEGEQ